MSCKLLPVCAIVLIVAGCATEATRQTKLPSSPSSASAAAATRDGSSFDTAIVIMATDESSRVATEYAWIREHIQGGKPAFRNFVERDGVRFDHIGVWIIGGSIRNVYFEISGFFEKT